ncbi:MAG: hypothetical protein RLZZ217_1537 [Planctomycetota bacterium]
MPTQHVQVDGVSFRSVFPAQRIVGAAAAGLRPPRLCVALVLLALWMSGGALWDLLSAPNVSPRGIAYGTLDQDTLEQARRIMESAALSVVPEADVAGASPAELTALISASLESIDAASDAEARDRADAAVRAIAAVRPRGAFESWEFALRTRLLAFVGDAVTLRWSALPQRLGALVWDLPREAIGVSWGFAGYLVLLFTVGMASIGIVLARMNALDLSEAPAPTLAEARAWGAAVRPSAVGAILVPLVGMITCIAVAGLPALLGLIPVAGLVGALVFGFSLLLGILAILIGASVTVALPFVIPAVACDAADAVEAPQRALASVMSRPIHALMHLVLGLVAVVLAIAAADVVVSCGFDAAASAWTMVDDDQPIRSVGRMVPFEPWRESTTMGMGVIDAAQAWILGFWRTIASALIGAAALSTIIAACTRAWLFQRQASEGQHPADILERP